MKRQLLLLSSILLFSYSAFSQISLVKTLGGLNNLSKSVLSPPPPPTIKGICCDSPPNKLWDKRFGGTGRDFINSSLACSDGGYLLGGYSDSPQGGDKSQPSQGDKDYWVVKIDANGTKIWDKRFGGTADDYLQSMLPTSDGGYLLGGYSGSDQNGDRSQPLQGYYDYWVVKIDANGTKLWDKRFGGTFFDLLRSMVATPDGGYLLGGYSDSPQGGDKSQPSQGDWDYWVVKIDAIGTKVWDKQFGGTADDYLESIVTTSDGGYLLGGNSNSPQGGDKSQDSQGQSDYWVVKIDAAGTEVWDKRFGGTAIDHFASVVATSDGSYLLGGDSGSPQGGDKSQPSQGVKDYWVVKIDANGTKVWDKRFGGRYNDNFQNIVAISDGGYLLEGYSDSPQSGDKSQDPQSSGWSDYWVVKIDANATKAWDKRFGGTLGEFLQSVVATPDGSYLLAGASNSGQNGDVSQASHGDLDYWVVKTTAATTLSGTVCAGSSVTLQASGCSGAVTWSTGTTGSSLVVTPSTSATYTATCTLNGFTSTASNLITLTVSAPPPTPTVSSMPAVCAGTTVTLRAIGCSGGDIVWYGPSGVNSLTISPTFTPLVVSTTTYYVSCRLNGCESPRNAVSLTVLPKPKAPVVKAVTCPNESAQTIWDKRFGGAGSDSPTSLIPTSDGGYLLGGQSTSDLSGDRSQSSQGKSDYWVVKVDAVGNKLWDRRFGGSDKDEFRSLVASSDGGYLLGGYSASDQSGDKSQPSQGSYDYWVIKIDANGNKLWDRRFGGDGEDLLRCVINTSDGGYLLGGSSSSKQGGDLSMPPKNTVDYWIVKIDATGNKLWDKRFGGGGTGGNVFIKLINTPDQGYLLGGYSNSDQGGDKSQSNLGGADYWVLKIDEAGNKLWDKRFGGSDFDYLSSLLATPEGGYLIGGNSASGQNGDKSQPAQGRADYWIVNIDANGNKLWDKRFGGFGFEYLFNIIIIPDGGYLLGGYSDSDQGGDKSQPSQGNADGWLVKIDKVGNKLWDKRLGGPGYDSITNMLASTEGGYFLIGESASDQGGDQTQVPRGDYDYWLIKLAECTEVTGPICPGTLVTLQATGCSGTTTWSTGATGASIVVGPVQSTTYTAVCIVNGCISDGSSVLTVTVSCGADLSVSMQVNTRTPKVGDLVSYSVSVVNRGPLPATNVRLTDILPVGLEYHSSASNGISTSSNSLTIDLGTIAIGSTSQVAFNTVVTSAGTFVNGIQIQSVDQPDQTSLPGSGIADGEDDAALVDFRTRDLTGLIVVSANPNQRMLPPVATNQPAPEANEADLSLAMQVNNPVPVIGSILSVTLLVNNRGAMSSGNVVVRLTLPAGWQWGNLGGWTVNDQIGTATISDIASGTMSALVISVMPGGVGAQQLKAEVVSAVAPDIDSTHGNGALNRGEDDEASVTVRVR